MAADAQLTFARCEVGEVRHLLEGARTERVKTNPAETLDQLLARGEAFKVMLDGEIVGAYLLEVHGPEVWILLAGGRAPVDLAHYGIALIEQQARDFDSIGFQTRRPGLIKKAKRAGFEVAAVVMRKRLR
ncbi:hypothetical protein HBDW_23560 [Herbaspirillum sp. DW155]|uniref:hypothetical protein n=1 Tax=Herbaspirillum sp. DW155 TaxID=3095609 RepID=UPI003088A30A|nr:hypothetical protein HBDW_23560 [Herbaspirillum sp. DW155]